MSYVCNTKQIKLGKKLVITILSISSCPSASGFANTSPGQTCHTIYQLYAHWGEPHTDHSTIFVMYGRGPEGRSNKLDSSVKSNNQLTLFEKYSYYSFYDLCSCKNNRRLCAKIWFLILFGGYIHVWTYLQQLCTQVGPDIFKLYQWYVTNQLLAKFTCEKSIQTTNYSSMGKYITTWNNSYCNLLISIKSSGSGIVAQDLSSINFVFFFNFFGT